MTDDLADDGFSSRKAAYDQLLGIEREGAFIGLDDDVGSVGGRARRQTLEYVAGITRWRRWLDFLLAAYYRGDYTGMELGLKVVLRIGLYDILFLSTPPYAAVNEAVVLAKKAIRRGAGGLVNGVLRSILRDRERLPHPPASDEAEYVAMTYSHPTWMVRRWLERYGRDETEALLDWNNTRPTYGIRINTTRTSVESFVSRLNELDADWECSTHLDYFVRMPSVQPLLEHDLLQSGMCGVQDESAALIVDLLDPQAGETVIDLCAAPGGKALHSAQRMKNDGTLVAVDAHPGRLRLVARGARSERLGIVQTVEGDARTFDGEWIGKADRVLVDAPCSGTGVLAKRADLRWRRTPEDLSDLTQLQDEILDAAAGLVRVGGILVYGTCTLEIEENQRRVESFIERHPAFELEDAGDRLSSDLVEPGGYYASFPPRDRMDGAFAARLRRDDA